MDLLEGPGLTIFGISVALPLIFSILAKPPTSRSKNTPRRSQTSPRTPHHGSPRRHQRTGSRAFPLESLPNELIITILCMAIESEPSACTFTFRHLSLVSRNIHRLACTAGLPLVDVYIRTSEDLHSFNSFLRRDSTRARHIRRLRINPFIPLSKYEEEIVCVYVVRMCSAVNHLACHVRVLEKVNREPFVHTECLRLDVWKGGQRVVEALLETRNMKQFQKRGAHIEFR